MVQPGRVCVFPFGRGSGKTFLGRAILHTLALASPNQQIGLLYPSLKQGRAVIWEGPTGLFTDYAMLMRAGVIRRYHRGELTAEYTNGSRVSTWGAENAHAILGQRFGGLVQDESDDIEPELERAVVQPTFSRSGTSSIWVKFGTPRKGRHGSLYASFTKVESEERGFRIDENGNTVHAPELPRTHFGFRLRSSDSPQVDQRWLAQVRAELYAAGKGATFAREYECDFDAAEGLVYSTFSHDVHVREPADGQVWTEILVGVDHGWEDPGVILVCGVIGHGKDATIHAIEEVYEQHRETSWWVAKAADIAEKYGRYEQRWYLDPSRPDRISDIRSGVRAKHGAEQTRRIHFYEADNAIEPGVDAVADRLAVRDAEGGKSPPRLFVSARCANTIAEFGKYRRKRDPKNAERVLDEIQDKDNHAMDALRYPTVTRFGRPEGKRQEHAA